MLIVIKRLKETLFLSPVDSVSLSVVNIWVGDATLSSFFKPRVHDAIWLAASQVPGMRTQIFHASYVKFNRLNCEASCDFRYCTCIKRLRAHPRHLTRRETTSIVYTRLYLLPLRRIEEVNACSRYRIWPSFYRYVLSPKVLNCIRFNFKFRI
jgi:hypothetical protein